MIGLREGCNKAMEVASEKGIDNFSHYRMTIGSNLDVYLQRQLTELKAEELATLSNSMLFIKTKYIARDSLLEKAIEGRERFVYGEYSIIPFEKECN